MPRVMSSSNDSDLSHDALKAGYRFRPSPILPPWAGTGRALTGILGRKMMEFQGNRGMWRASTGAGGISSTSSSEGINSRCRQGVSFACRLTPPNGCPAAKRHIIPLTVANFAAIFNQ
jgi:hypothetical protein